MNLRSFSALRRLVRPAPLALAALAATVSCFHGTKAPSVSPKGTLAPGSGEGGDFIASQLPFGVVYGSPRGETVDASEITLVFNRPMRALQLAGSEAQPPVTMTPAVPGAWRWVGTNGLLFAPDKWLPRATRFVVEVPAGTRALDGSTLPAAFQLAFSTPPPKLVSTEPREGEEHLVPSSTFALHFNQPVADDEVSRAVKLLAGDDKPFELAFEVTRPDPKNPKLARLRPRKPLPLGSTIALRADASLRGTEGPLPAGKTEEKRYHTYGPLSVGPMSCPTDTPHGRCAPRSAVSFNLSNAVRYKDLKAAVTVTPPVKLDWWSGRDDDYQTRYVHLSGAFAPAQTYQIRVKGDLKDRYGQRLGRDVVLTASFDDLWPSAEIGVTGTYFEPKAVRDVAVASVNVKTLELATAALDEDAAAELEWAERGPSFDRVARLKNAKVARLHPAAAPNATHKQLVRPADVLGGAQRRGPIAIGLEYTARPGSPHARKVSETRVVQVTDLGISAKLSRHGSLVWVTRLSDGQPVAGAEVRVRRPGGSSAGDTVARTDAAGLALVSGEVLAPRTRERRAPLVIVRSGDDWAYRDAGELLYGWRYGVSTDLGGELRTFGMMFTERGVYRPGDTVRLKGILRTELARGTATPAGANAAVTVTAPNGDKILDQKVRLSEFGTFALDVTVPKSGELGTYSADVQTDTQREAGSDASATFEVAEYRPAEFQVAVESGQPSYVRGDKASWTARGDFLFGAPMAKAQVRTTVTRGAAHFAPPGTDELTVTDTSFVRDADEVPLNAQQLQSGRTQLDDRGAVRVDAALSMPGQRGAETVTCEAEVMDLSRQTVAASASAIVHPGEFYVALRAGRDAFVKAGDEIEPQVLAVEPSGKRRAGVKIDVELVQRTWATAREQTRQGGLRTVSRTVDKTLGQCEVTTSAVLAGCKIKVPSAGYFIVRGKAKDGRGNPLSASTFVYAMGDGAVGWSDNDESKLELVLDKKSYEVGQSARILVKSPFATADALVTIERAGVYSQRRMQLAGAMPTITIPVTDEMRPNAYVSVLLVRGRTKAAPAQWNAADVGAPAFRLGFANVLVNPEARRLAVAIQSSKKDYRPGEQADVEIAVKDREGKGARAEVTLYAVDEGVLMLTGYKTPDPIPTFTDPRPLQVGVTEARADLARLTLSPIAGVVGGDKGLEGGGGGSVRKNFQQSAYFNPSIVTDDGGRARVSFKLPDSLTTYRIMAVVAARDDRFGFGEARVTTSRPLMARPAFPRLLRAGDEIQAGVIVTSKGLARSRVEVIAEARGVQLTGDARREIDLESGQSIEVPFAFRAPAVGAASFRFAVAGGGERDAVEIGRQVAVPMALEAVALYGETRGETGEKLGDLSAMRDDAGELEVSVASTALVGLSGGVQQLVEYPYECTEQLTSRLVPLVALRDLARDFQLPMPKNADAMVASTVAEILKRQRAGGGFGMWPDSPAASPWASTYALWGLGAASRRGAAVPKGAIESGTRYVRDFLAHWEGAPFGHVTAAFVLDVLAESGDPDAGYMNRLFEQREKLPLFGRAYLAHAMAIGKGDAKALGELVRDLEGHLRVEGNKAVVAENLGDEYAMLMDSSTRTNALALRALLAARTNHPMGARLAHGILEARKGGQWRTTQESAYALLALDEFRKAQEKDPPDFVAAVWLGGDQVIDSPIQDRTATALRATVPVARALRSSGATLAFQMQGEKKGTLYYEARLRYARKAMPREPIDRGFFVQKAARVVAPEALESAIRTVGAATAGWPEVRGGDLVLVDLLVVSPQPRDFVVIDDPLPAGLEAVSSRLATTAASLRVPGSGGEEESVRAGGGEDGDDGEEDGDEPEGRDRIARGDAILASSWFRQEVRDDRVMYFVDHMAAGLYHYRYLARATTPGTFVLPPTRAEAMYAPEIFGRTAGGSMRVIGK